MVTKQIKPKPKDREATEERLLLAAEQVFSKYGFKGATTRMIAKKANINVALITRYFDGKYGLLLKLVERKGNEIHYMSLPYPIKDSVTEECLAFAFQKYATLKKDKAFFNIVIAQFLTDPIFLKQFQETLLQFDKNFTDFESRLNELINKKKMVKDVPIKKVFEILETFIFGLIIGQTCKPLPEDEVLNDLELFVRMYCKSLEP